MEQGIKTGKGELPNLKQQLDNLDKQIEIALEESGNLRSTIAEVQRKYKRVYRMASVELFIQGETPIEACSLNVSPGGICVYTLQFFPVDTEVKIRLFYTADKKDKIFEELQGEVRWYRRIGKFYRVGIAFKNIDPITHSVLLSLIQSLDGAE